MATLSLSCFQDEFAVGKYLKSIDPLEYYAEFQSTVCRPPAPVPLCSPESGQGILAPVQVVQLL